MTDENEDPLEVLYGDKGSFEREKLASALDGVIGVDKGTGEPIYEDGFAELSNQGKFVALLVQRRAAVALDEIEEDEIGLSVEEAAKIIGVTKSAIHNYPGRLGFVESESSVGGYYLLPSAIDQATQQINAD